MIFSTLAQNGYKAYIAGGFVRDSLLGRKPKDLDIVTNALPADIENLFPDTCSVGKEFGVVIVRVSHRGFEVATFRKDNPYLDGRHPNGVEFSDEESDARRRDFTINGLFYDPLSHRIIDYVNGLEDIDRQVIRAIGNPDDRFDEDHLRVLRAARFASVLEFTIDPATSLAVRQTAPKLARISRERIREELTALLTQSPRAGRGLELLRELGILDVILPDVAATIGQAQPPEYHPEGDVFTHTKLMLDQMENTSAQLAYAVLLHDIGKPLTATRGPGRDGLTRIRFDGHAEKGADMAEKILRGLAMSNSDVEAITHCIRNHMRFIDVKHMRTATLRRFVGGPYFATELELHRLDCLASHGSLENYEFIQRFLKTLASTPPMPERWISGRDVMALGIPEGPEIGHWVETAYECQLEGSFTDKQEALHWLREQVQKRGASDSAAS
ncbi:MAG: CCA tRNA nucleotidyltransferase [Verrucomicrobia bacterium]|nr:CCA tRNA nucleotidyltransferase [Verrucomicrobiota bacterium]